MDKIIDRTRSNEINSRLLRRTINFSLNGKNKAGATVYIGAPSSDFRVRIYDKALEQGVERIRNWVENQVGPSLYVLMKTMGIMDIYSIAASSAGRISAQQEALITDFQSLCSARRAAL